MFEKALGETTPRVAVGERSEPYTGAMLPVSREDLVELITFVKNRPRSITIPQISDALMEHGEIGAALEQLSAGQQESLFEEAYSREDALLELKTWTAAGYGVHSILDEDFPARLRDIHECPPLLFTAGLMLRDERGVSVVGSRKASGKGLEIADSVASALAREGLTVISGLAAGIDTAAHKAALAVGGRTLAVIGNGLNRSYPAANEKLQLEIVEKGLVISQFWPDAPPRSQHFPIRNATMSGLGIATFVAEAGETSGARIQARKAVEHGRPVILSNIVVERNEWAKRLIEAPNIWQASSVDEVMEIVGRLVESPDRISDLIGTAVETFASRRAS